MNLSGHIMQKYVIKNHGTESAGCGQTATQKFQPKADLTTKPDTFVNSNTSEKKKINKKKIGIIVGAALAAAAAAGGIIYAVKTGKIGESKKIAKKAIKELKDIKFDKGVALIKESGERFTGQLNHTLKSGDKVALEYADGVLQKSTRSGKVNFEKIYKTINGEKLVYKTADGISGSVVNITGKQKEAKLIQEKLKSILENQDKLTSEEFLAQTSEIKYKSKSQIEEITKIVQEKQNAEAKLTKKVEAELQVVIGAKTNSIIQKTGKVFNKEEELRKAADEIIDGFDDEQIVKFKAFLENNTETVEYNNELIRHATTSGNAENIKNHGYDIFHGARNCGSNNYGGMDAEIVSIKDFGSRYGDTKLEYEFTGKAIKMTNEVSNDFMDLVMSAKNKAGESVYMQQLNAEMKYPGIYAGDISNTVMREILQRFGFDAIAVAPRGETLFLTIINPNDAKGLKYTGILPA